MEIKPEWIEVGDLLTLEEETYTYSDHWEAWIVSNKDHDGVFELKQSSNSDNRKEIFYWKDSWWGEDITYKICLYKKVDNNWIRDQKIEDVCG